MSQHRDRDEQAIRDYLAGRGEDLYRQRFQALVEATVAASTATRRWQTWLARCRTARCRKRLSRG